MSFPIIDAVAALVFTVLLPPFIGIVLFVVFLASVGKTVGIRLKYVEILLYIFEFGKKRLAKKRRYLSSVSELTEEEELECNSQHETNDCFKKPDKDAHLETHEFELSDSFQYIAKGMQTIVDDEVTKRFTAEELTSWNFLTRTNHNYEFISIRLTIFWVVGFIFRYCFLLPLRVSILSIGVGILVVFTTVINFLPECQLRKWLGYWAYLATFRLVSRAISAVVYCHNLENRPKSDGICVANHTSPIDCAILSCDNVYAFMGLIVICTYVVGSLPNSSFKRRMNKRVSMFCFDFLSGALSLVCCYHNKDNVPRQGICVANHTSPMDVLVLACDNTYDMVGQRHGGFLGIFQRALSRASDHIWFERGEVKDRYAVARRLKAHVEDPSKMPILIFPEGTCINNTSVMQFKKGTFEVGGIIYPVAIKYDPRFGDAFWNSSKYSMMAYIYMMMTSWAIVCDVWYLPPMSKREKETSIEFANRVKAEIAKQGGLVDLLWDGALKRSAPKKELKEYFQQEYSRTLKLVDDLEGEEGNQNVVRRKISKIEIPREEPGKVWSNSDVEKTETTSPKPKEISFENLSPYINSLDNNFSSINGIKSKVNGNIIETESKTINNDIDIVNGKEIDTEINKLSKDFETELRNRQNILENLIKENVPNNFETGLKTVKNSHFMNGEKEPERQIAE
ncbi:UNVERIFIED_CONTAM: hypothetical protein RMT77_013112 [Armadillidium vulgare]